MKRLTGPLIVSLGMASFTLLYITEAKKLPFGSAGMPGAGFMPMLIGGGLFVLCILLAVKEFFLRKAPENESKLDLWEEGGDSDERAVPMKPLILGISFLFYAFAFSSIGFVVSTLAILWICLRTYKFHSWHVSLCAATIILAIGYVVFALVLNVQFPHGFLY